MERIFRYILVSIIIGFLFYRCILKEEINCGLRDTLDNRHELIDSLYNQLDSLHKVIDTLQYENEIFDYNTVSEQEIISALMYVESSNNDSAYNASEDAVGCLQIRKTMVNDVNRILRKRKSPVRFTYEDRWCRYKSINMFKIYCKHYNLTTAEEIARCWNGGPRGLHNPATVNYWKKVQSELDIVS
tara:strand:+ start:196 stop:756 length:561 start_codon:yes stop_codon:yes gene_type:complete